MAAPKVAVVGGGIGGLVLRSPCASAGSAPRSTSRRTSCARSAPRSRCRPTARASCGGSGSASRSRPSRSSRRRSSSGAGTAARSSPTTRSGRDGTYEATFGAPYYGVHRVALLEALGGGWRTTGSTSGAGASASTSAAPGPSCASPTASSATADLIVGADGVHSVIRPHVAGEVRGRFSGHGRLPRARPRRGHALAPRSDAAAVLGRPAAPPPALRDRRRPDGQLPRRRPRPGVDRRHVDGGVRGQRRPRGVRRLAPGRDRDGRRHRGRGTLGAVRPRTARALAHPPRGSDGRRGARHGPPPGPGRQPDYRGRDRARRLPGRRRGSRGGIAALRRAPARADGQGPALVAPCGRPHASAGRAGDRPPRCPVQGARLRAGLDPFLRRPRSAAHAGVRRQVHAGSVVRTAGSRRGGPPGRRAARPRARARRGPGPAARLGDQPRRHEEARRLARLGDAVPARHPAQRRRRRRSTPSATASTPAASASGSGSTAPSPTGRSAPPPS